MAIRNHTRLKISNKEAYEGSFSTSTEPNFAKYAPTNAPFRQKKSARIWSGKKMTEYLCFMLKKSTHNSNRLSTLVRHNLYIPHT